MKSRHETAECPMKSRQRLSVRPTVGIYQGSLKKRHSVWAPDEIKARIYGMPDEIKAKTIESPMKSRRRLSSAA